MTIKNLLKRSLAFLLCLTMCLGIFNLTAYATPLRTVRVGWFAQTGYQELTEDGKPYGLHFEYLTKIAEYTNWKYEFVLANSFSEAYDMLKSGDIDLLGFLLKTPQREAEVVFPELNSGYSTTSIFTKQDSDLAPNDYEAFNNMTIACMESTNPEYLKDFANSKNFKFTLKYYRNYEDVVSAVANGKVDAGLMAGHPNNNGMRVLSTFAPKPYFFATKNYDIELAKELNYALNSLKVDSPFLERDLTYKYLPEIKNNVFLTTSEKKYIENSLPLKVSYSANWFPITTSNGESDKLSGIVADVFARITDLTGLRFEYYKELDSDYSSDFDINANAMANHFSKNSDYELSSVYLTVPLVMVKKKNADFAGKHATTAAMNVLSEQLEQNPNFPNEYILRFDTLEECIDAVSDGKAQQALVNAYVSEYLFKKSEYRSLTSVSLYNEAYNLCIGVSHEADPVLLSIINKAISAISASDMSAIINKNVTQSISVNLGTIFDYMPAETIIICLAFLLLILTLSFTIIIKQRRNSKRIQELLYTDELTGILSYRGFVAAMPKALRSTSQHMFIIDLDINRFSDYNTINGHQRGNELLCNVANCLCVLCAPNTIFARVQDDRFVCFIAASNADEVFERCKTWLKALRRNCNIQSLLISFGVYEIKKPQQDIMVMCDRALIAKRSVKGSYDQYIALYNEEIHSKQLSDAQFVEAFEKAISEGQFIHYFQPKYDVISEKIIGAEALVRWQISPDKIIFPGEFIELFEQNDLISKLDHYLFEQLCVKFSKLLNLGIEPLPISINFSRAHLFDSNFTSKLLHIINMYDVPAKYIEIEITETAFAQSAQVVARTVTSLHELGFKVAIDDFGTGYSSLNMLKDMDFDIIKLDREFLNDASQTTRGYKVVQNIISLAHDLNLKTVAEGVETVEQLEMLKKCGGDMVQGFYFSRPMPEEEFDKLLIKNKPFK